MQTCFSSGKPWEEILFAIGVLQFNAFRFVANSCMYEFKFDLFVLVTIVGDQKNDE